MNKTQTLLEWSQELSPTQPDTAALLARAAALLLSRAPKAEKTVPIVQLPAVVDPSFSMKKHHAKIFKILQELPGSTIAEIALLTDRTSQNIHTQLSALMKAGLVTREAGIPNGVSKPPLRWFVRTDKGREEIA